MTYFKTASSPTRITALKTNILKLVGSMPTSFNKTLDKKISINEMKRTKYSVLLLAFTNTKTGHNIEREAA